MVRPPRCHVAAGGTVYNDAAGSLRRPGRPIRMTRSHSNVRLQGHRSIGVHDKHQPPAGVIYTDTAVATFSRCTVAELTCLLAMWTMWTATPRSSGAPERRSRPLPREGPRAGRTSRPPSCRARACWQEANAAFAFAAASCVRPAWTGPSAPKYRRRRVIWTTLLGLYLIRLGTRLRIPGRLAQPNKKVRRALLTLMHIEESCRPMSETAPQQARTRRLIRQWTHTLCRRRQHRPTASPTTGPTVGQVGLWAWRRPCAQLRTMCSTAK
jgi:hypothetical protein